MHSRPNNHFILTNYAHTLLSKDLISFFHFLRFMGDKFNLLLMFSIGFVFALLLFAVVSNFNRDQPIHTAHMVKTLSEHEKTLPIVLVDQQGIGKIGNLTVRISDNNEDNSDVTVINSPFSDYDFISTAEMAVDVAKEHTGKDSLSNSFQFIFDVDESYDHNKSEDVFFGGDSSGAAAAVATILALEKNGVEYKDNVIILGNIRPDGSIGRVSDILAKIWAVSNSDSNSVPDPDSDYDTLLIPTGQTKLTLYEEFSSNDQHSAVGSIEYNNSKNYREKTINLVDLADELGLEIIGISNITQALEYITE